MSRYPHSYDTITLSEETIHFFICLSCGERNNQETHIEQGEMIKCGSCDEKYIVGDGPNDDTIEELDGND